MKTKLVVGVVALSILCFLAGTFSGFFIGVWSTQAGSDFLEDMLSDEERADVSRPRQLVRQGFRLEYPGNWRIDSTDEDHDPDHLFSIESPGSSFAMFRLFDFPSEPATNVDGQVRQFSKLLNTSKKSRFKSWGKFNGEGAHLQGRMLGLKCGVKIFSFSSDSRSFVVVSQHFDEDAADVQPGFELIESTFELIE